jgi:hypothetical protein
MTLMLAIEASKSDGSVYRLLFGWRIPPLASWFADLIGF